MAIKGDPRVIELLNETLKNELTAVNQYWLHYRLLDHWGVYKLAQYERAESIDEMKHADWLAERILFLDGLPNFQLLGRLRIGETVEEVLKSDLAMELEAVEQLKGAIDYCEGARDFISRELFARILASEEEHVDTLERQFEMIARMGLHNYVQLNAMSEDDKPNAGAAPISRAERSRVRAARTIMLSYRRSAVVACRVLFDIAEVRRRLAAPRTRRGWVKGVYAST